MQQASDAQRAVLKPGNAAELRRAYLESMALAEAERGEGRPPKGSPGEEDLTMVLSKEQLMKAQQRRWPQNWQEEAQREQRRG